MAGGRIKGLTVTIDGDTTGLSGLWCQAPRPGGSNIDWGDMSAFPYTCPVCKAVITTQDGRSALYSSFRTSADPGRRCFCIVCADSGGFFQSLSWLLCACSRTGAERGREVLSILDPA